MGAQQLFDDIEIMFVVDTDQNDRQVAGNTEGP